MRSPVWGIRRSAASSIAQMAHWTVIFERRVVIAAGSARQGLDVRLQRGFGNYSISIKRVALSQADVECAAGISGGTTHAESPIIKAMWEYGGSMAKPLLQAAPNADFNREMEYRVESIARAATPEGLEGVWYQYVIAQGTNMIKGMRCGDKAQVDDEVRDMVERLNERRVGKTRPRVKPAAPAATPAVPTT